MPGIPGFWIFMCILFTLTPFALIGWALIAHFTKGSGTKSLQNIQRTALPDELRARRELRKKIKNKRWKN